MILPGSSKPSVPGQIRVRMVLSTTPTLLATSGAGAIASAFTPSLNSAPNAASFKTTYDEFRIVSMKFHAKAVAANAGVTAFYVDDADSTAPTATSTWSRRPTVLPNSIANSGSSHSWNYRCEDVVDLEFLPTSTGAAYTPCALKVYTDSAVQNSPISSNLFLVWAEMLVEFRGIGSA